jgi:NH3-dependent NAD+ synthetase
MGRFDLIEVTAWAGLTYRGDHMGRFDPYGHLYKSNLPM